MKPKKYTDIDTDTYTKIHGKKAEPKTTATTETKAHLTPRGRGQQLQNHRVLDLFSGIGGFAVALRSVADTVGYCETDPHCLAVLRARMEDGRIDTAPVFDDVRELSADAVSRLRPDMVVGGFPCQDISSSGQRAGLDGSKSNLFFEIVRILRSVRSIQHVLLENSPFIRTMGLPRVRAALKEAGFAHVAYGYFNASDVGALHRRTRWVCLASKRPDLLLLSSPRKHVADLSYPWKPEPVPRIIFRTRSLDRVVVPPGASSRPLGAQDRCSLLGNSVVPQFIAHCHDTLARAMLELAALKKRGHATPFPHTLDGGERGVVYASGEDDGSGQVLLRMPYAVYATNETDLRLVDRFGNTFYTMRRWYTPVHSRSAWFHVQGKTERGRWMNNTANNIYYERRTKAVGKRHTVNPSFIEHLMGYPLGWTSADLPV